VCVCCCKSSLCEKLYIGCKRRLQIKQSDSNGNHNNSRGSDEVSTIIMTVIIMAIVTKTLMIVKIMAMTINMELTEACEKPE
jgi:hypothetical protein